MDTQDTFWNRICDSIFIKSPQWFDIIQTLPYKLDANVVRRCTVSAEGVSGTGIQAIGWIHGGIISKINPNPLVPGDSLNPARWAYLQVALNFFQFEGLYNHLNANGMASPMLWDINARTHFLDWAQTMSFYSAMLILCERGTLPTNGNEGALEEDVLIEMRRTLEVLTRKTCDYGQGFLRHGIPGLMHRVWDKLARYATLCTEDRPTYEPRFDSAQDMLGYSLLIWSILEDRELPPYDMEFPLSKLGGDVPKLNEQHFRKVKNV